MPYNERPYGPEYINLRHMGRSALVPALCIAFFAGTPFFFCVQPPPFPMRPEKASFFLVVDSTDGGRMWTTGEDVTIGIGMYLARYIDSAHVDFGDNSDTLLDLRQKTQREDTVFLVHRYNQIGTVTIELQVWVESLGGKGPISEQIEIACDPAEFVEPLDHSQELTSHEPFVLAASCRGTTPLEYQWHELEEGPLAEGVTDSLRFSSVEKKDTGSYFCVVANQCGMDTSDTVVIPASLFLDSSSHSPEDTVGPAITPVSPQAGAVLTNETIPVKVNAIDPSGIAYVSINGRGASLQNGDYVVSLTFEEEGTKTIRVVARDGSDNGNVDTLQFDVTYDPTGTDTNPPEILLLSHEDGDIVVNRSVVIGVVANDENGIEKVAINGETARLRNGRFEREVTLGPLEPSEVLIRAWDASSNRNVDSLLFTLTYDSTSSDSLEPRLTTVSHQEGQTVAVDSVPLIVTATDINGIAHVTIDGVTATFNNGRYRAKVGLVPGQNTIECKATDASRNANVGTLRIVLYYDPTADDSIAPIISPIAPKSGDTVSVNSVVVRVEATDANGIANVTIGNNDAELVNGVYQHVVALPPTPGRHQVVVTAQDASTNRNAASIILNIVYDSTFQDRTPPLISREAPAVGMVVDTNEITMAVEATDDNGISSVTIGGERAEMSQGLYVAEVTLPRIGINEIEVTALDNSSRRNMATEVFEIIYEPTADDRTPPSIRLRSPLRAFTESPVNVTAEVTDANGVSQVRIDGKSVTASETEYSREVALPPGTHQIEIYAQDNSYNANDTTHVYSITYDPPPTAVSMSIPASGITTTSMKVTWDPCSIDDFASYKVLCGTSESGLSVAAIITERGTSSWTLTDLREGTNYYVQVVVLDQNGSSASSTIVNAVTSTLSRPEISLLSPAEGENTISPEVSFQFEVECSLGTYLTPVLSIGHDSSIASPIKRVILPEAVANTIPKLFSYTLSASEALGFGRKYYWKVSCAVSDGSLTKSDSTSAHYFFTENKAPQWKSSLSFANYRNQTMRIPCIDQLDSWVNQEGHELSFSLIGVSGGGTTINQGVLAWHRPWDFPSDTVIQVRAVDSWEHGEKYSDAEFTITEKATPTNRAGMRYIEAGTVAGVTAEKPFWMDTTEVTLAEFNAIMLRNHSGYVFRQSANPNCREDNCPVDGLNWYDAALFCNALTKYYGSNDTVYAYSGVVGDVGKNCELTDLSTDLSKSGVRLPTDEQWEFGYRSWTETAYYWGDAVEEYGEVHADKYAWWVGNSYEDGTHAVALKTPNDFGLYDMAGNLWEWCHDLAGEGSTNRILHGGSYASREELSATEIIGVPPNGSDDSFGFRCTAPIEP